MTNSLQAQMLQVELPPEIQQQALSIDQRRKMVELLRAQALAPTEKTEYTQGGNQWAPPIAIKQGILPGIAKLGAAYFAGQGGKEVDAQSLAMAQALKSSRKTEMDQFLAAPVDKRIGVAAGASNPILQALAPDMYKSQVEADQTNAALQTMYPGGVPSELSLLTTPGTSKLGTTLMGIQDRKQAALDRKKNMDANLAIRQDTLAFQRQNAASQQALQREIAAGRQGTQDRFQLDYDKEGNRVRVNMSTGEVFPVMQSGGEDGSTTPLGKPVPESFTGIQGARALRTISSINQTTKALHNIATLPITASSGMFSGAKQGPSLVDASIDKLANKVTSKDVQLYNTVATGIQRNIANIESQGLAPTNMLVAQMEKIMLKDGDTNLTKMAKLAEIRQISEAALEILNTLPTKNKDLKKQMVTMQASLEKAVPFTVEQVLMFRQSGGKESMNQMMTRMKKEQSKGNGGSKVPGDIKRVNWSDLP